MFRCLNALRADYRDKKFDRIVLLIWRNQAQWVFQASQIILFNVKHESFFYYSIFTILIYLITFQFHSCYNIPNNRLLMISKVSRNLLHKNTSTFCSTPFTPLLYGNGKSIVSLSQWWNGSTPRPSDYYVEDKLQAELSGQFKLQNGIFRVVFAADLSDPSMNININLLKKSSSLNQLLQLSASQKQQLVENPSTVVIRPIFSQQQAQNQNQIAKNMLELDKLFQEAVGLKTAYLINADAISIPAYLQETKKRPKAVICDVALKGKSLGQVVFDHGHKLQHVFFSYPFSSNIPPASFEELLAAMDAIDFKGKLILSGGSNYNQQLQLFQNAAKKSGFSQKLQFALQTDGWYTMT